jgi:SAM-dependent methyltransferase
MFEPLYDLLMSDVDYEALFHEIKPYLKQDDLIIDAGCGSGYMLIELIHHGYRAIGLDVSTHMLALAEEKMRQQHLMTELYEHDLRKPMIGQADVILAMFDVVNYFKGVKKVFRNIHQALYPQGRFIFDCYQISVLNDYDGYVEDEVDPVVYRWESRVSGHQFIHEVSYDGQTDKIIQYVYDVSYYIHLLESLGFDVEVKPSIDIR